MSLAGVVWDLLNQPLDDTNHVSETAAIILCCIPSEPGKYHDRNHLKFHGQEICPNCFANSQPKTENLNDWADFGMSIASWPGNSPWLFRLRQ
jgi:hypothetical protein